MKIQKEYRCKENDNDKKKMCVYTYVQMPIPGRFYSNETAASEFRENMICGMYVPARDVPVITVIFVYNSVVICSHVAHLIPHYYKNMRHFARNMRD